MSKEKDNPDPITSLEEYLREVKKVSESPAGLQTIYRGHSNSAWEVESGAYTRNKDLPDFRSKLIPYNLDLVNSARRYPDEIRPELSDLEVLAQLQHYQAATHLLDFSYNALIALYFACQDSDQNGKVFCLRLDLDSTVILTPKDYGDKLEDILNLKLSRETSTQESGEKQESSEWQFGIFQPSYRFGRIIKQDSVFVITPSGKIENDQFVGIITIEKESKESILKDLKLTNINNTSVFPDFIGYAQDNSRDKPLAMDIDTISEKGNEYFSKGEYEKAIEYYDQALEISREIRDKMSEGNSLSNLGSAYRRKGEYQKAIEHHEQALKVFRKIRDRQGEGINLGNSGNAYFSLGEYQKAIEHYKQALKIFREIRDRQGEGINLGNLGIAYKNLNDFPEARDHYRQAIAILEPIGSPYADTFKNNLALLDKLSPPPP